MIGKYPCQNLLGGTGEAIYHNVDGMCDHPECNPETQTDEIGQVDTFVIAQPEDCKGCVHNWGSFNTEPDDSYCYMFQEFMPGCKQYTKEV